MNKFFKNPILYSFRRCPYAMRARMAIILSGSQVELREVLLKDIPKEMRNISPKATVPVLQMHDGKVLEESIDIMDWALQSNFENKIWETKIKYQGKTENILKKIDGPFKYHLDRYKYHNRYLNEKGLQSALSHREEGKRILDTIEVELSSGNKWIFGEKPSYLDIAILPFIRQYRIADIKWFDTQMPLNNIRVWLHRFLEWDVFLKTMKKYQQWIPGSKQIFFGKEL